MHTSVNMTGKVLAFLVLTSMTVGCTSNNDYENTLSAWKGSSEEKLVEHWGQPNSVDESNGRKNLVYQREVKGFASKASPTIQFHVSGNRAYPSMTAGSFDLGASATCTTTFTLDNAQVSSWRYEGEHCGL